MNTHGTHTFTGRLWVQQKTIHRILDLQRATAYAHLQRTTLQVGAWLDRTYPDPKKGK